MKILIIFILILSFSYSAWAGKKVQYRKTQNVSFDGSNIDGEGRNPDGSYLHQKRGVKFLPLYKVRKSFDENIKDSVEYLK